MISRKTNLVRVASKNPVFCEVHKVKNRFRLLEISCWTILDVLKVQLNAKRDRPH